MADLTATVTAERPLVSLYQKTEQEIELETNETSRLQKIKGSPRIWYVDIEGIGAGIFKPTLYSDTQNERAAYLVSHILGFAFVPTTVLRRLAGEDGSLQQVIEDHQFIYEVDSAANFRDQLYKLWIFGHIIRNMDRHDDNFLIKDGQVFSIDHDSSFDPDSENPGNFDLYRNYYGEMAPKNVVEIFRLFLADPLQREILRDALDGLIDSKDIEETLLRIEHIGEVLIQKGVINSKEELRI